MSATTKAPAAPAYVSGFCGLRLPASSHARCPQVVGATTCTCDCHRTCPTCGQHLPAATANRQESL